MVDEAQKALEEAEALKKVCVVIYSEVMWFIVLDLLFYYLFCIVLLFLLYFSYWW